MKTIPKHIGRMAITMFLFILAAQLVAAQLIWDNGPQHPDGTFFVTGGVGSGFDWINADDFVLTSGSTIDSATLVWGTTDDETVIAFDVRFYGDGGTIPLDPPLAEFFAVPATVINPALGVGGPFAKEYSLSFPPGISLPPGTYWVSFDPIGLVNTPGEDNGLAISASPDLISPLPLMQLESAAVNDPSLTGGIWASWTDVLGGGIDHAFALFGSTGGGFCGDNNVDPGETCDDGNTVPGDGCDENCQIEAGTDTCNIDFTEILGAPLDEPTCDLLCQGMLGGPPYPGGPFTSGYVDGDYCICEGADVTSCDITIPDSLCWQLLNVFAIPTTNAGNCNFGPTPTGGIVCGDGICDAIFEGQGAPFECELDCGPFGPSCGNAICEFGEEEGGPLECEADCGPFGPVCGDLLCEPGELETETYECEADCGPFMAEECDDGNLVSGDGCNEFCQAEFCGDGIVQPGLGEECDDGNTNSGDGCSSSCNLECDDSDGDGYGVLLTAACPFPEVDCDDTNIEINPGATEVCDGIDNNCNALIDEGLNVVVDVDNDGIPDTEPTCIPLQCIAIGAFCGDNIITPPEECDDGNTDDGDGCSSTCEIQAIGPFCGDLLCDPGEDPLSCPSDCTCGDGVCDPFFEGQGAPFECEADCGPFGPVCGDLLCEPGEEEFGPFECEIDCGPFSLCGNGAVDPSEDCDSSAGKSGSFCPDFGFNSCLPDCTCPVVLSDVIINEIRVDQSGPDTDEYFELAGAPGTPLDGLTYIVIGDNDDGNIEFVFDLSGFIINGNGYFVLAEATATLPDLTLADHIIPTINNFENGDNVLHLLVEGYTGTPDPSVLPEDIDLDNDGIFEAPPWSTIVDGVGIAEELNPVDPPGGVHPSGTEWNYAPPLGLPTIGPDGTFSPTHVYRCDPLQDWTIGLIDEGTTDTPGAVNLPC